MLCYIDLEHSSALTDPHIRAEHEQDRRHEQALFTELSGRPCELLVLEHEADRLDRMRADVVLLSGLRSDFAAHAPETLARIKAFIRDWEGPLIGFCGGHQLIAHAFGAAIGPLGPLAPGEVDPDPTFGPGMRKETGMTAVTLLADDPLFAGLPNPAVFYQEHYWEVKHLPDDFICLASSPACTIQALRHRHRPIFSTQFHPERSDPAHPHGWRLLRNVFDWVRTSAR